MNFDTLCIHTQNTKYDNTGAISVPIFQTATFAHPGVGESTGYDYSRLQNPTREYLEKTVATLENGTNAIAFSSGMAAISALMEIFHPGDHLIASDDIYGGSHRLFHNISKKNGISFDLVNTSDIEKIKKNIKPETKAIFIETPTNPMMQVSDIAQISAFTKDKGLILIVDNTFLTPYFQRPLDLGADIVIHSGTKYLGGHNDTLAGFLVVKHSELNKQLRYVAKTTGACLSPFDSWLIIRGIKTLPIRMDKQQESSLEIANWLNQHKKVNKVFYVGLPTHPDYDISKKQAKGFGSMISFEVDKEDTAKNILEHISLIQFAESLGGVESLITYPIMQTHADIPKAEQDAKGINHRLLRLSIGLENVTDLINDLKKALEEN